MDALDQHARAIWNQKTIPVILRRPKGKPLRVRLPYRADNRSWLRSGRQRKPQWLENFKCWETPKAWLTPLVNQCLERFGHVYLIQPFREMEKCAPACMDAVGFDCECSCMGQNHGAGNDGSWFEVSEAFAFRWGPNQLACRLISRRKHLIIHDFLKARISG